MKKQLLKLGLPILLCSASIHAQSDVWDFGANDLSRLGYTNKITVDIVNTKFYPEGTPAASENLSVGNFTIDETISYVTKGNDRIRTDNPDLTRFDDNLSPAPAYSIAPTYQGCLYANGLGDSKTRYLAFQAAAGEVFTFIVSSNSTSGSDYATYKITDANADEPNVMASWEFGIPRSNEDDKTVGFYLQFKATDAGEYRLYDDTSKIRYYRVYRGNISNPLNTTLGLEDLSIQGGSDIKAVGNRVVLSNVKSETEVNIYAVTGALIQTLTTSKDMSFEFKPGLWFATVKSAEGQKSTKLLVTN
ncbi:hypothetical protein [Formosa sp. S-31]|uniref:hypothetical protein n=1 Tax=Formosa sp. S-31 TaxID=2790949 RepID=UPI003EC06DDB